MNTGVKSKRAVMITRPDGTTEQYESGTEASREEGVSQSDISKMARTGYKHKGFSAKFVDSVEKPDHGSQSGPEIESKS